MYLCFKDVKVVTLKKKFFETIQRISLVEKASKTFKTGNATGIRRTFRYNKPIVHWGHKHFTITDFVLRVARKVFSL